MTDKIVVLSTCDSRKSATNLAHHLVETRVAACVNVIPKITSVYRWQGKVEESEEWLLIIKTRRDLFTQLRSEIGKQHSYEVPELIALPIIEGAENYLAWMDHALAVGD